MLKKYKNLILGISEKDDGSMKFLGKIINNKAIRNRKLYLDKNKINSKKVVAVWPKHTDEIRAVTENDTGKVIENIDGLITNIKDLYLSITAADCLPIYFYDFKKEVIGIAHAGWLGVLKNISGKMIAAAINKYSSNPKDIQVYIGPHIQKCHFEVKDDVARKFIKYKDAIIKKDSKIFINLSEVAKEQLVKARVLEKNINISHECTFCLADKYFSNRREKLKDIQAMIAYIGMK